jgi:hypothetical protein
MKKVSELATKKNITFLHSDVKKVVFNQLQICGFMEHTHKRSFFWDLNDAVLFASKIVVDNEMYKESKESNSVIDLTIIDHEKPSNDYSPLIAQDEMDIDYQRSSCRIF